MEKPFKFSPELEAAFDATLDGLLDSSPRDSARRQLDQLVSRALADRTGMEIQSCLKFGRRFPRIAPFNAKLLHTQNRGIRYAPMPERLDEFYTRWVK